jgi:hypothetical protein
MKTPCPTKLAALLAATLVLAGVAWLATRKGPERSFDQALAGVPEAELPARAAALVAEAKPQDQPTDAARAVRAAIKAAPASTLRTVGAICRAVPATASAVAAAAAQMQPEQAGAIAKAAAAAAPAYAAEVTQAVLPVTANMPGIAPGAAGAGLKAPPSAPPHTPGGGSAGELEGRHNVEAPPGGVRSSSP